MLSTSWLFPLDENTVCCDLVVRWTGAQLSFNIHPQSLLASDCIMSSPSVGKMLSSPRAFKRWMNLSSNFAFRLEYTAAVHRFFGDHSASTVSGELHIFEGSCAMVASCNIHLKEPLNEDGVQDASKNSDPEVRVFLTNFKASSSLIQEKQSRKMYAATGSAGTPKLVLQMALPNMKARTDQPLHSTQCKISL